jgi:hypothetical protein
VRCSKILAPGWSKDWMHERNEAALESCTERTTTPSTTTSKTSFAGCSPTTGVGHGQARVPVDLIGWRA